MQDNPYLKYNFRIPVVQMESTAEVLVVLQEVIRLLAPLSVTSQKTQSLLRHLTAAYRHLLKKSLYERQHNQ